MGERQPILRMEGIDKRFPGVHALDHVDFDLYAGEVHVLLGENGAGKSTLMKILSGSLPRDGGRIFICGQEIDELTPERATALGIGMVYQELSLAPNLSAAENIFLGHVPRNRLGLVDWRAMRARASESLASLGLDIDPDAPVRQLDVAAQQLTEIARVLSKGARILLLDEPTSALSEAERDRLFVLIRRLQAQGVGVIYISHRLAEVWMIGQRVTVMRDGKVVGTLATEQASEDGLIQMMVGRQLGQRFPKHPARLGQTALRVEDLSLGNRLHNLSFEVREGEILGIFGLMGAGQAELARAIFGLEPEASGRVFLYGQRVHIDGPTTAIRHGLGFLTRDRRQGLVPALPIPPNITLADVSQFPIAKLLDLRSEARAAARLVDDLRIHPPLLNRRVMFLSGGNQQKVVLARWLYSHSKVLIFDEPTRGIDVGAKTEVFDLMSRLTQQGAAIIMISSEMPEILAMADRILVMRDGRFTAEYGPGATQEDLLRSASQAERRS
jgi:ribose transport system ATP-binding protein